MMTPMAETVRIERAAHTALVEIARSLDTSLTDALSLAIAAYRRQVFIEEVNAGYAAMRSDPRVWAEEMRERETWDQTSNDGLEG